MAKRQRLALPWALAAAVVTAVLVAAVPSSDGNLAREPSPFPFTISKRQGNDSLVSNLPPTERPNGRPNSPAFEAKTIVTTTTTTSSSTLLQTISTPPSVPSTDIARPDPALTTSTSTSTPTSTSRFTTTAIRAAATTPVATTSSTSLSASSTSTTSTSTTFRTTTSVDINPVSNPRPDATLSTTSFVPTYTRSVTQSASVNDNQGTSDGSSGSQSSDTGFMQNKGAVGATFTVVGLVGAGLIICAVLFIRKRMRDRNLNQADWDEVDDLAMFASASTRTGGGTRGTVIPPSAALPHRLSIGGHGSDPQEMDQDRPESVLAMPPVMNYERPGDSAYNIIPVVPPQLRNQGKHSSFGSMLGGDPFAGGPPVPWQEAERDSAYGPGQAGRGAGMNALQGSGYSMQPHSRGAGVPDRSEEDAYGGATYGSGQQATRYQYGYPSHAFAQQYTNNSQQGGYGYGY